MIRIVRGAVAGVEEFRRGLAANEGDRRGDVFRVPFDSSSENVATVVVRSVATIHNVEPTELPPLENVVDLDALRSFVRSDGGGATEGTQVTFIYEGLHVTVGGDGDIWLEWT